MLVGIKKKMNKLRRIDIIFGDILCPKFINFVNQTDFLDWVDIEISENPQYDLVNYQFTEVMWRYLDYQLDEFIDQNLLDVEENWLKDEAKRFFKNSDNDENLYSILSQLEKYGLDVEQLASDCNYIEEKYIW